MLQVVWLDVIAARARYGRWIGGCLPSFVPVPMTGKVSARAQRGSKGAEQPAGSPKQEETLAIRLKRLRYGSESGPLKLQWYHRNE